MIGKTNAVNVGNIVSPTVEMVNISLLTNQSEHDDLLGAQVTVSYGESTEILDWIGSPITIGIPVDASYVISVSDVTNYKTPQSFSATAIGGNARTVTLVYKTEKVTVDVSANDGTSVEGQVVTIKSPFDNGVYIQDINGALWSLDKWDESKVPNGVAVITEECNFVISLQNSHTGKMTWGGYGTLVEDIATTSDESIAVTDFNGQFNTKKILESKETSNTGAAYSCNSFVFPNGGKGYLGSAGEWQIALGLKDDIELALSKCGGVSMSTIYLTSTQMSANKIWIMRWQNGYLSNTDKSYELYARAFQPINLATFEPINRTVTNGIAEFYVAHDTVYEVNVDNKEGYASPSSKVYTADSTSRYVDMVYNKVSAKITTIRIDQTITDPSTMITRIVDEGGIEAIRANSHRYTGTFANGVMTLKQLDDTDGTKYADGTTATLTTIGTDVWMKLPQFHWKCSQYATDVWDFEVVYGAKPDDTYKTWDGNDLIGAYEAYNSSNKSYSVSGKDSTGNVYQDKFKTYARARGEGFSLVKWKHHCMMAMLYYTMYGNTNCQAKIGKGTDSSTKATGATNSLGMTDTVAGGNGDSNSINFWGLENWWGNKEEWVDNVAIDVRVWKVTEDDGTVRQAGTGGSSNGWISKLLLGENIDLIPTAASGSETTGYCDYYAQSSANTRVFVRSSYTANTYGGVACANATQAYLMSSDFRGSRLAFRGNIVIE